VRSGARIAVAGGLIAVGLGVPLAFMWVSGHAAAAAEHDKILAEPVAMARAAAERIAKRVALELADLAEREGARPYYQWQSVIVDPRGLYEGEAVVPSPLAEGPTEPLVLSHFQIDDKGVVTSPEVNEAEGAPAAKEDATRRLGSLRAALAGRRAEPVLAPDKTPVVVPQVASQPVQSRAGNRREDALGNANEPLGLQEELVQVANAEPSSLVPQQIQVQQLSNADYRKNANAPEVFSRIQQNRKSPVSEPVAVGQVTVRIGPFEWESLALDGHEVIAASRAIQTPDAPKRQGFVVDPERLATLLLDGERTGTVVAADAPPAAAAVEVGVPLPGLAKAIAVALPEAAATESMADVPLADFRLRSILLTAFAALAAAAIFLLVVQAERMLERRQRFAAAAAHELRTPLAGLRMYAEMLAHGLGKPEKQQVYAERLASEAARLGRVVANVLDFTRLERKSLAVHASPQDVAVAVEDIVRKLEPSLVAAGASLVFVRPTGPALARIDGDALAQILGNLVDNAEKYGRAAKDRTITVTVSEPMNGTVEVRVSDRGPGLPNAKRLFRPFTRGAPKDGPAGLGLGLALARALARAQGGELVAGDCKVGAELILRLAA